VSLTTTAINAAQFWQQMFELAPLDWFLEAEHIKKDADERRKLARFNTGTISTTAAVTLRAICAWLQPAVIIEVGTFIGVSTESLAKCGAGVFTCDISNDCYKGHDRIFCYPWKSSTQMFQHLLAKKLVADLFFFDGLLSEGDVDLIKKLSKPDTVYVTDDYQGRFKGVRNMQLLMSALKTHVLMPAAGPVKADTTLAALIPESRL